MSVTTDPRLQQYGVSFPGIQPSSYESGLASDLDSNGFNAYALNQLANTSVNSAQSLISPPGNAFAQPRTRSQLALQNQAGLNPSSPTRSGVNGAPHVVHANPTTHTTPPDYNAQAWNVNVTIPNGPASQSPYYSSGPGSHAAPETPKTAELGAKTTNSKEDGGSHFSGMKLIPNPPNLEEWRERLFNIEGTIVMTEEEFQTYFPHVDNVYSHRSTQKYKRKPFVSHYWDCRLKGRPPGTPKSDDPNKKKRKRLARERDLCDVKIKITEYFGRDPDQGDSSAHGNITSPTSTTTGTAAAGAGSGITFIMENDGPHHPHQQAAQQFGMLTPNASLPPGHPGANGARYFTIQRVNGGAGGDKDDESDFQHRHTLEESDRIKKNSVQRWLLKEEKDKKRQQALDVQASRSIRSGSSSSPPSLRTTGLAQATAKLHQNPQPSTNLTLFCNAFCPFAQRVWIALEVKKIPYQLVEVVPPQAPDNGFGSRLTDWPPELLEVCDKAYIPCIRHGKWGVWESGVMMEYLEDLDVGLPLLPLGNPKLRAHCRLWVDHINRKILPAFYALLLTPPAAPSRRVGDDPAAQLQQAAAAGNSELAARSSAASYPSSQLTEQHHLLINTLQASITSLVNASHQTGPFFLGDQISFVDVAFAPWIIRLSRVLSYYRNFPRPEVGTRWRKWVDAVEADERVRATVSEEGSYHNVYETVGSDGFCGLAQGKKGMVEREYAKKVVREEGFGLGGDVWGRAPDSSIMPDDALVVRGGM